MSLKSALVDRAHTWEITQGATDAYGEPSEADDLGQTFRCRVSRPDPNENKAPDIEFIQYERDLVMLAGTKAEDGSLLAIEADDRIVVEAGPFSGTYDVVGKPRVIRKKRKQIGWEIDLKERTGKAA